MPHKWAERRKELEYKCEFLTYVSFMIIECSTSFPVEMIVGVDTAAIGTTNSEFVLQMVSDIMDRLDLSRENIRISAIGSGCPNDQNMLVDSSFDLDTIQTGLHSVHRPGFQNLMRATRLKLNQGRNGASKVGILFLADNLDPVEYKKSIMESRRSGFQNVRYFVVGIGDRVNATQAQTLVGSDYYMSTDSYDQLGELETPLLMRLCSLKKYE